MAIIFLLTLNHAGGLDRKGLVLAYKPIQSLFEDIFHVKWSPKVEILPLEMGHLR
jgi:hypothetical protein